MARQVSTIAESMFDAEIKHIFQDVSKGLRNTVRVKTGVVGSTYNFPLMNKGMAHERVKYTDVTPMNIGYTQNTCTLTDWTAAEYSDIFDNATIKADEIKELAVEVGNAITRRLEQIIIDAQTGAGYTKANSDIPHGSAGLTIAKVLKAKKALDKQGVPSGDRFFVCGAAQMNDDLLATTQVTSADYNSVKALVNGEINTFLGFQWKMVGDRDEGGLPLASSNRTCIAYHKASTGLAIGLENSTSIDWIAEKRSWLAAADLKAGAVVIDPKGIVLVICAES